MFMTKAKRSGAAALLQYCFYQRDEGDRPGGKLKVCKQI
jgi:hypothetical protein